VPAERVSPYAVCRREIMKWIILLCVVAGIAGLGLIGREATPLLPVISRLGSSEVETPDVEMFVVPLRDGAVVVRSLSQSEWASYQVRAEAWSWIEAQMVAAAMVLPPVTASEAAALPKELSHAIRRAINAASGFEVFTELDG